MFPFNNRSHDSALSARLGGSESSRSRRSASTTNRPRCAQCGSRRFRRDASTGQLVCREGHVLQGYREEEVQDDGEFVNTQSQRRYSQKDPSLSSKRRRSKRAQQEKQVWGSAAAASRKTEDQPFDGRARAAFQCYECLQLILRLQLKALRLEWPDLPPEIEAIARDLWTYFVSLNSTLQPTPHTENFEFVKEQLQTARAESDAREERRSRSRSRARMEQEEIDRMRMEDTAEGEDEEEEDVQSQKQKADESIRRIERGTPEDEDQEEQQQQRATSSTTPSQGRSRPNPKRPNAFTRERMRKATWDPMNVLISIIYLSLITARVPILWADLHRLLSSNRLPYLSATQLIPDLMLAKLPEHELRKLEVQNIPSITSLQERTSRLASDLTQRFSSANIRFPELNAPPILWRLIRDMGLPPTFYDPTRALLTYLGIPLAVVPDDSVSDPWSLLGAAGAHPDDDAGPVRKTLPPMDGRLKNTLHPPHATRCSVIMAALVVLAKMRYGLDGRLRYSDKNTQFLSVPSLDRWLEALAEHQDALKREPQLAYELNVHPSHLTDDQIDSIIDFAEEAFFEKSQPNLRYMHRKGELVGGDLFPGLAEPKVHDCIRPYAEERAADRRPSLLDVLAQHRQRLHERLYPLTAAEQRYSLPTRHKDKPLRPGDLYMIQETTDEQTEVHPSYRRVLGHAASVVGLSAYGDDEDEEAHGYPGWREMGQIVADMEKLLLQRIKAEGVAKRKERAAQKRRSK